MKSQIKQFYTYSKEERHQRLAEHIDHPAIVEKLTQSVDDEVLDHLIENYMAPFELPLGIATNFIVNEQDIFIPMVTEEPSVIAAASHAAKLARYYGGFKAQVLQRSMTGEVILEHISDVNVAKQALLEQKDRLLQQLNELRPSMVKRGGGATEMEVITFDDLNTVTVYFFIDTKDAMGANMINSLMEQIAPTLETITQGQTLLAILSNYATETITTASCLIPYDAMGPQGKEVATRIKQATDYAYHDVYRAVTHNKGIMNGIEAVTTATGNDTRALSACIHAYASRHGQYQPLTRYELKEEGLYGEITLLLPVGIVGGATKILPLAQFSLQLMDVKTAEQLMEIMASVGLAQNIAALKALVTEGIQKGHMNLQAKSLAMQVGAHGEEIEHVAQFLRSQSTMTEQAAKAYLASLRQS